MNNVEDYKLNNFTRNFLIVTTAKKWMRMGRADNVYLMPLNQHIAFVSNVIVGKDLEYIIGKGEVTGSIPVIGSNNEQRRNTKENFRN